MIAKKTVRIYVDMVADLFHFGHVNFLKQARSFGDELVVGIHSDETVASYKRQPIMTMKERIAVVESCRYVDQVVPNAPLIVSLDYLEQLEIDYLCHGDDIDEEKIEKWYGEIRRQGRLKIVDYTNNISTTNLINRVRYQSNKLSFVSQRIKVDFIAYHDLQAQAGLSVFQAMNQHFDCSWLIGPDRQPTGATAAVLLDHTHHQPAIKKSSDGYKYLFYLSHDLGDVNVYQIEKQRLKNFNIIFVPGPLHLSNAQKALGPIYAQPYLKPTRVILEGGWPKYDLMQFPNENNELCEKIFNFPYKYTIIYAPTWAYTREWEQILPLFRNLQCNLIIKNHIYVNPGQSYPKGLEAMYEDCLTSANEMEEQALSYNLPNITVAPRNINICSLFPLANVLISDVSSVSLEFIPFGISIETGRFNRDLNQLKPESSLISDKVHFLKIDWLNKILSSEESLRSFLEEKLAGTQKETIVSSEIKHSGKLIATLIDKYLSFWEIKDSTGNRHSLFADWMNQWQKAKMY